MGKPSHSVCTTGSASASAGASTKTRNYYNFNRIFYNFLSWSLVHCFLFHIVSSDPENLYPFPTAHVELFSFDRGTLKVLQDKVNVPVTLSQPTRYFELYMFQCNGSYPVQWTYIGEGNPITTADAGRSFRDFYDIKSYSYQSILLMYKLDEFQSGRYICRGMLPEHEKVSIYYDVFVPVDGKNILLTNTEKTVYVQEDKETAYIPCGVSDSTAEVALYKSNPDAEGTYKRVEDTAAITFSPRKGFKIRLRQVKEPYGKYMCTAKSNSRRRKVNLYPLGFKMYNEPHNPYFEKYPVQFSYDYKYNRMLCCTGTTYVPRLQWAGCTSILDCQIKSVCFDEDRCEPRIGMAGYDPNKWIDPGPLPSGCSGWKLRNDPNGDMGMFKCTTPGITQYQPYLLNRGNIFLDFETAPPAESIMTLRKMSKGPVYVGRQVEFHCNGTRFYFGYGFRWAYQRGNGDIEFIEDSDVIRDRFFVTAHRRQTVFRIPHADIKAIVCFGPIVNHATEWRTTSMPLQIEEEPIFVPLKPDTHSYEDLEHYDLGPHHNDQRHHEGDTTLYDIASINHDNDHHHHQEHDQHPQQHDQHHHGHDNRHHEQEQHKHVHPQQENDRHPHQIIIDTHHVEKKPHHHEPQQPSTPLYYDISPYHDSSTTLHKEASLGTSLPELSYDPHLIDYSRTPGSYTNAQVLADKIKDHIQEIAHGGEVFHKQVVHEENNNHKTNIQHYKPDLENTHHHPHDHGSHNILTSPRNPDIIIDTDYIKNPDILIDHDYKRHPDILIDPDFKKSQGHDIIIDPDYKKAPDIIHDNTFKRNPEIILDRDPGFQSGGITQELDIIHVPATQDHYERDREMHASNIYNKRPTPHPGGTIYRKPPPAKTTPAPIGLYKHHPASPTQVTYSTSSTGPQYHTITENHERNRGVKINGIFGKDVPIKNHFNTYQTPAPVNIYNKREPSFPTIDPYIAKQQQKSLNINPLNIYSRPTISSQSLFPSQSRNPSKITEYTKIYKQFPSTVPYKEIPLNPNTDIYGKDISISTSYSTIPGVSTLKIEHSLPKGPSTVVPFSSNSNGNSISNPYNIAHFSSNDHKYYQTQNNNHISSINNNPQQQNNPVNLYRAHPTSATHYAKGLSSPSPAPYLNTALFKQTGHSQESSAHHNSNNQEPTSAIKAHFTDYYNKLSPSPTPAFQSSSFNNNNYQYRGEESKIVTTTSNEGTANKINDVLKGHFPNMYPKLVAVSPPGRVDAGKPVPPTTKPLVYSTLVKTHTGPSSTDLGKLGSTTTASFTLKDSVPSYKQIKQTFSQSNQGIAQTVKNYHKNNGATPITFDVDFIYPVTQAQANARNLNHQNHPSKPLAGSNGQLITQKILAGSELFNPQPRLETENHRSRSVENINYNNYFH